MTIIKPRTRGKHLVPQWTRLDRDNRETLHAYAAFINEDAEYILNQLIETVLAKDRDFVKWRAQHPESHVPPPSPKVARRRRRSQPHTPAAGSVPISASRTGANA